MFSLFKDVKSLFKLRRETADGYVFRVNVQFTCGLLCTFVIILLTAQFCGTNIHCDNSKINQNVLDSFCWIHGTYSVLAGFNKTMGVGVPYPGVMATHGLRKDLRYHKYYQWTVVFLIMQAILFYTPRWLWKSWEGGKIHALMMDLDIGICSEVEKKQKKKLMIDYLWENLRFHNWWAYRYYLCEFLALINVIGQMFLMNRFFDGAFLTFGIEVIQFLDSDEEDREDPMIRIFPRMTKCTFFKYGASGEVERHDAICILPLNVVNEKIYVFLWFWFIILSILTLVTIVYRIIIIFSPRMRVYLLRIRYRLIRKDAIDLIVRRSKMGDWFLFYMLGENVDSVIFRDVMHELAYKLGSNPGHHIPGPKGEILEA